MALEKSLEKKGKQVVVHSKFNPDPVALEEYKRLMAARELLLKNDDIIEIDVFPADAVDMAFDQISAANSEKQELPGNIGSVGPQLMEFFKSNTGKDLIDK